MLLDKANGLTGKTVIHPTHVAAVHALSVVTHEEYCDAGDILGTSTRGGVAASAYGNKMNESKPHAAWARRIMSACRGVRRGPGVDVVRRSARCGPASVNPAWTGSWVADRLDVRVTTGSDGAVSLPDLVGLALRRNPRRAHLIVSTVLGKHVPTDPRIVYGSGRLLGALVAAALGGGDVPGDAALAAALRGDASAPQRLLRECADATVAVSAVVLGYAETATGLGHAVADQLVAPYLHSTRRAVTGVVPLGGFEEEHSHATTHLLLPEDTGLLARGDALVLVDDELTSGRTVLNTIRALHASFPQRRRYVVAALVDVRTGSDRAGMAAFAAELGVELDVVSLVSGQVDLPADVLDRAAGLVEQYGQPPAVPTSERGGVRVADRRIWPTGVREGGRHGFLPEERPALEAAAARCAAELADHVSGSRVLVLGTEELMHAPLRIALALADRLPGAEVRFSTTTRSPVCAIDAPGYAIATALTFPAHDDSGTRFAYNVASGSDPARGFSDIVLVVDDAADPVSVQAPGGIVDQLATATGAVHVVTIPTARPRSPEPLRGPRFGSYPAEDVGWLLTDLSAVQLEAPIEEREEAIQAGGAHYAESLPIEYQPTAEYQELYTQALAATADQLALAVGVVTEQVLAARGNGGVLVSLARAGTPVGVLMRRWARFRHGVELAHYSASIVRGKGIDTVALRYLADHHDPASVMFVDGWTGKGAITGELERALESANRTLSGGMFSADLAVLADAGGCTRIFGTREDYLIPSACLNSTVSGLVSRTVLNDALIGPGQFHGAKFYAELAGADVSRAFVDAVAGRFADVEDAVDHHLAARAALDTAPTWQGWKTAEELSERYGIGDVNLVKPGVGETTRVLLRRVPWRILVRPEAVPALGHVLLLAEQRGVAIEEVPDLAFSCVGLIHPRFTRGAVGADGTSVRS